MLNAQRAPVPVRRVQLIASCVCDHFYHHVAAATVEGLEHFDGDEPVVVPSGSCAAMMFHGAVLEFEKEPDLPEVEALGRRTWELGDFIVNGFGVKTWPGKFSATVALHRACHTRGTGSSEAA